ncbi:MAG: hypothetical protein A3B70_07290 [Deltaproteobacteria bacterium RIFCSPHIGHO2_02_FULL_40_11]|nr:MAG: hypothetical protein A3B70_07290 [Deltaproteobacteria bacterium RIFCSPHIGHO2_02_FULL_40_11]
MANELLKKVIDLTQLPTDQVTEELERLLEKEGVDADHVSLWELRQVLAKYIEDVFKDYEDILSGKKKDDVDDDEPQFRLVTVN